MRPAGGQGEGRDARCATAANTLHYTPLRGGARAARALPTNLAVHCHARNCPRRLTCCLESNSPNPGCGPRGHCQIARRRWEARGCAQSERRQACPATGDRVVRRACLRVSTRLHYPMSGGRPAWSVPRLASTLAWLSRAEGTECTEGSKPASQPVIASVLPRASQLRQARQRGGGHGVLLAQGGPNPRSAPSEGDRKEQRWPLFGACPHAVHEQTHTHTQARTKPHLHGRHEDARHSPTN